MARLSSGSRRWGWRYGCQATGAATTSRTSAANAIAAQSGGDVFGNIDDALGRAADAERLKRLLGGSGGKSAGMALNAFAGGRASMAGLAVCAVWSAGRSRARAAPEAPPAPARRHAAAGREGPRAVGDGAATQEFLGGRREVADPSRAGLSHRSVVDACVSRARRGALPSAREPSDLTAAARPPPPGDDDSESDAAPPKKKKPPPVKAALKAIPIKATLTPAARPGSCLKYFHVFCLFVKH